MTTENLLTEITTAILDQVATILVNPLTFGCLTITINFRSGMPDRYSVIRNESFLFSKDKSEDK